MTVALVTGGHGQLARALVAAVPAGWRVVAPDRAALDITDARAVTETIARIRPDVVVNAAAFTGVDAAESDPALAFRVNRDGAAHLAAAAHAARARFLHVSTDYVFDGRKSTPYVPDDAPNPLSVYGESKLAGERMVADRTDGAAVVVRTAWVHAQEGRNFLTTMVRLLRERPEVRVVSDQIGTPTHAPGLARALWALAARADVRGTLHWTDAGVASWYDFAVAIRDLAQAPARVVPIPSFEYKTPARRPSYGVLDKAATWALLGIGRHWRDEVALALGR